MISADDRAARLAAELAAIAQEMRARALRHKERNRHGRAVELVEYAARIERAANGRN